jgi:SnoaL-like polyketide cyclase
MSKENLKIVADYIEQVINQQNLERFSDFCSEDCITHSQPYVGIGVNFDDSSKKKLIVFEIAPGGPAEGHLQIGDELVRVQIGEKTWTTYDELIKNDWAHGVDGTELTLSVRRHGDLIPVQFKRGRIGDFEFKLSTLLKTAIPYLQKNWPDLRMEIKEIFSNGDMVACYAINSGTNLEYNHSAIWAEIDIFRLKDGKIVETWSIENSYAEMMQLGYQFVEPARVSD